ncbi:TPA: hypothetical protein ACWS0R_005506, partial [Klebsiella pneumoniae]
MFMSCSQYEQLNPVPVPVHHSLSHGSRAAPSAPGDLLPVKNTLICMSRKSALQAGENIKIQLMLLLVV